METTWHKEIVLLSHFQLNKVLNDLTHLNVLLKTEHFTTQLAFS